MIVHRHKCIFIHIPKTAGSSIERVLNPNVLIQKTGGGRFGNTRLKGKHWTAHVYRKEFPHRFDAYFKFMFVRNPWERELSRWMWNKRIGKGHGYDGSFKAFVTSRRGMGYARYGGWGKTSVDFIGRFENLQKDFNTVCDKIGIPKQKLPHSNKHDHKHYTHYYDDQAKKIVAKGYTEDIERFGYEFGN